MKSRLLLVISSVLLGLALFVFGWLSHAQWGETSIALQNPFVDQTVHKAKPMQQYAFRELAQREYQPAPIKILRTLETTDDFTTYLFSYETTGRIITGTMNVPKPLPADLAAIVMVRGWVPQESYYSGMGTKNAAAVYARNGFVTLAPDFLGHGESDPEIEHEWESRFARPVHVIELIEGIRQTGVPLSPDAPAVTPITDIGLWGHSNGGQIATSVVEILSEPLPATLWAPVTAPFPYSILFFSDEDRDEGKAMRQIIAQLESDYDVFDFTITKHLDLLTGPMQIHHGTADDAAIIAWSDEFVAKVEAENTRRQELREELAELPATEAAQVRSEIEPALLEPIELEYFRYPGANHNLQPGWDTVVARDLEFFRQHLR